MPCSHFYRSLQSVQWRKFGKLTENFETKSPSGKINFGKKQVFQNDVIKSNRVTFDSRTSAPEKTTSLL
jgi:hypothetical protein